MRKKEGGVGAVRIDFPTGCLTCKVELTLRRDRCEEGKSRKAEQNKLKEETSEAALLWFFARRRRLLRGREVGAD